MDTITLRRINNQLSINYLTQQALTGEGSIKCEARQTMHIKDLEHLPVGQLFYCAHASHRAEAGAIPCNGCNIVQTPEAEYAHFN